MALIIRPKTLASTSPKNHGNRPTCLVDPAWDLIDPNPNIHDLFLQFNDEYFEGKLVSCEVKWSQRMTSCAGFCRYEGHGGLCSISLSQPLLKFRPRKDMVQTLLHEMIHAYLFVTQNNRDRDAHGPEFHRIMYFINSTAGTNITVYHSFHAEVAEHQKHWWRCEGVCRYRKPFFGWVKRAMNRAPGPADSWFEQHQESCGGRFVKVKEPEGFKARTKGATTSASLARLVSGSEGPPSTKRAKLEDDSENIANHTVVSVSSNTLDNYFSRLPGQGHSLISSIQTQSAAQFLNSSLQSKLIQCPVCEDIVIEASINSHLDTCLTQ